MTLHNLILLACLDRYTHTHLYVMYGVQVKVHNLCVSLSLSLAVSLYTSMYDFSGEFDVDLGCLHHPGHCVQFHIGINVARIDDMYVCLFAYVALNLNKRNDPSARG